MAKLHTPKHRRLVQARVSERDYAWLVRTSKARGISLAELLRRLVVERREQERGAKGLEAAIRDVAKAIREGHGSHG